VQYLNKSMQSKRLGMTGFATDWVKLRDVTTRHRNGLVPVVCHETLVNAVGSDIQRGKSYT